MVSRSSRLVVGRRRAVAGALTLLLAAAPSALAQDADPRSTARVRIGEVYVAPTLTIRDVGLDTNVYNESLAEPIKDFAFTVAPAFNAIIGPRRANLTVRSVTDFVYYAQQQSERSLNEDISAMAAVTFARIQPYAEAGYLNTRQRMSEEIDARARRVEWRGRVGTRLRLTPRVEAHVSGDVWRMAFDADAIFDDHDLARELNRRTETIAAGVRYTLTPLTSLTVSTDASRVRFAEAEVRNAHVYQTYAGVAFHPRALVAGSVQLGYQRFRPDSAEVPEFSGLSGAAGVSYRFRAATTVGFQFTRRIDFSYLAAEPYYLREGYGFSVRRQLAERWDVEAGGTRTWHRYRQALAGASGRSDGHVDRLFGGSAALGHDIGPRTRVTLGLSYQHRESDFTDRRFSGLRVAASAAYGF